MITVMTVKDNGNYSLPDFDDIGYINQTTADENGNYAIGIPIFRSLTADTSFFQTKICAV